MPDHRAATEPAARRAQPSIWTFLAADCFGFGLFFCVFMGERFGDPASFDASARRLDVGIGLANTLILLTSSWLVVLATEAARNGAPRRAWRIMLAATIVGGGFAVLKITEYVGKISHGITPATDDFFSFYFMLTGVHFLHYLIGLGVLIAMVTTLRNSARSAKPAPDWIVSGALYWHMVDLLWLFLFPMLYLLGAG